MPSKNKTKNIKLNQWQENEYPKMIDFNEDNALIDKSIAEIMAKLGQLDYVTNVELVGNNILITKNGNTTKIEIPKGFSGDFNDLQNVPDLLKADWNKIENKPSTYPSTWENVSNKPADYPTDWDYVKNKPSTYPSTWENVSNKPSLVLSETLSRFIEQNKLNLSKKVDKGVALSNVDLNQIFEPNFYSARSCLNIPKNSNSYGSLIVTKADLTLDDSNTDTIQIYIDKNSNMYIRNCIDQTANWSSWKEYVSTTFTGELNNLQTENKTSLVSAINEVFQFGVDKGNKIISKLNALFDKKMMNLGEVANEIDKYDVVYKTFLIKNMINELNRYENKDFKDFIFFRDKALLCKDKYAKYFSESDLRIYDLNTGSQVEFAYINSKKYDFKNSTNLHMILKNSEGMLLFDNSIKKIIEITKGEIDFSFYDSYLIKLNNKYLLINLDYSKLNVYDMVERKIIKTINFDSKPIFLAVQKNKIYLIDDENNVVFILDKNFQKIRSIKVDIDYEFKHVISFDKESIFVFNDTIMCFNKIKKSIFFYDSNTGNIKKSIKLIAGIKPLTCSLVPGILDNDKIYYIKDASKDYKVYNYRLYSLDKNGNEIEKINLKNLGRIEPEKMVIFNNNIFWGEGANFFKISKALERK